MFLFIWVAFVQLIYLFFYDKIEAYSDPLNAFTTSFECLVGKFDKTFSLSSRYALGPVIIVIYPIVMAFMIINIFVTIVCDAFKAVRTDIQQNDNELQMVAFFRDKIRERWFCDKKDRQNVSNETYVDTTQRLPQNVDRLIKNLSKVIFFNLFF